MCLQLTDGISSNDLISFVSLLSINLDFSVMIIYQGFLFLSMFHALCWMGLNSHNSLAGK